MADDPLTPSKADWERRKEISDFYGRWSMAVAVLAFFRLLAGPIQVAGGA